MVQSTAANVDAWFEEVDPARKPWFEKVRALAIRRLGPETEEMAYGMPAYRRPGDEANCFAFNSQKQHISLYVSPRVHPIYEEELKSLDAGKSCIRFRRPEQVDLDLLDRMLADSAKLSSVGSAG